MFSPVQSPGILASRYALTEPKDGTKELSHEVDKLWGILHPKNKGIEPVGGGLLTETGEERLLLNKGVPLVGDMRLLAWYSVGGNCFCLFSRNASDNGF